MYFNDLVDNLSAEACQYCQNMGHFVQIDPRYD